MHTELIAPTPDGIARAAAYLRAGALVAFPTETVYGLGANAWDATAIERVFAAKGRPHDNPLIVHVPSAAELDRFGHATPQARRLAERLWPGPLTIVVRGRGLFGAATVALRMPSQPLAIALLRASGRPLAAPSANRSGRPSPTTAQAAMLELDGRIEAVLAGPACAVGIESTVVDVSEGHPVLLRPGHVDAEQIAEILDCPVERARGSSRSPGTRYRHYAPRVPVLLYAGAAPARRAAAGAELARNARAVYIGLEDVGTSERSMRFADLASLQAGLYEAVRRAEEWAQAIVLTLPEEAAQAEGVRDRMIRMAGGRVLEAGPEEG